MNTFECNLERFKRLFTLYLAINQSFQSIVLLVICSGLFFFLSYILLLYFQKCFVSPTKSVKALSTEDVSVFGRLFLRASDANLTTFHKGLLMNCR